MPNSVVIRSGALADVADVLDSVGEAAVRVVFEELAEGRIAFDDDLRGSGARKTDADGISPIDTGRLLATGRTRFAAPDEGVEVVYVNNARDPKRGNGYAGYARKSGRRIGQFERDAFVAFAFRFGVAAENAAIRIADIAAGEEGAA